MEVELQALEVKLQRAEMELPPCVDVGCIDHASVASNPGCSDIGSYSLCSEALTTMDLAE